MKILKCLEYKLITNILIYMQSNKIHKVVYLVGLHIYYKMIHGPYNIKLQIFYYECFTFHSIYLCRETFKGIWSLQSGGLPLCCEEVLIPW